MIIIISIFLSILGAALYRLGGIGKPFNTFYRDAGTSLCGPAILLLNAPHLSPKLFLACLVVWGLGWGSMTTYFKKKGTDAQWYNWLFVGLAFGIAALPYAYVTGEWLAFAIRLVVLAVAIPIWCIKTGWDDLEEGGRGFLYCVTFFAFKIF